MCKEELNRLIEIELEERVLDNDATAFQYLLDSWRSWDVEFICLVTCLSQILEQKSKQGLDAQSVLEGVYSLPEKTGLGFTIEEFGEDFVVYMLRYVRRADLSIEENLVEIRNLLSEYVYP